MRGAVGVFGMVVAAAIAACSPAKPVAERDAALKVGVPGRDADIMGTVTALEPGAAGGAGRVRIEERPGGLETGGEKAVVTVTAGTRLLRRDRAGAHAIAFSELRVGDIVDAWWRGPVMESYPVQVTGDAIVVR